MAKKTTKKVTPLMKQYGAVKQKYPDAILLFRVGDFYETFGEDAVKAARVLGIVLTNRNNGGSKIELAGFPYHSLDLYLPRLVRSGFRVAICEQLEKPSKEKKIVKRGVTEVVTPGLASDGKLLDHKTNNYLASVAWGKRGAVGMAFLDISTGEFLVAEGDQPYLEKLVQSLAPSEIIFSRGNEGNIKDTFGDKYYTFRLDDWVFTTDYAREKLTEHFEVKNLKGFGIEELALAQIAAGAVLHYLATTENKNLQHVNRISRLQPDRYVWLDRFTIRNLELVHSQNDSGVPLIKVLDKTVSPMGARLLKKWLVLPLKNRREVEQRLEVVQYFFDDLEVSKEMELLMRGMGDLERLISKVPLEKINPREIVQLRRSLAAVEKVKTRLSTSKQPELVTIGERLNPCDNLRRTIGSQIKEDPPVNRNKGGVFADDFHPELDDLRTTVRTAKELLDGVCKREAAATGIDNLKVGFNNVFGYYLEVTNKYKNKGLVPDHWTRKQTLTGSERYISQELKQLETKILGAQDRILELEEQLYAELLVVLRDYIQPVQANAALIARLDCLLSFARVAQRFNYVRPNMNDGYAIDIRAGRHPVIEQQLDPGLSYVPNDTFLDRETQQIMMITGPNMAGKSALLRQTALISLLAQMGSFVPAERAELGMVDKVFTRVGASDNISSGESTFMVEMNETALIMNNVSDRSLILLDEIGRGTSTYDGISIAWSIAEYLHNHKQFRPKTLFATHYHELNELANKFERIKNFNIAVRETGQKIIFLRKLTEGGSAHSFGIHVAKMAGMPRGIVERAGHILSQLEQKSIESGGTALTADGVKTTNAQTKDLSAMQLSIFETNDPVADRIKEMVQDLDVNTMTPIECMMKLNELKNALRG